MLALPLLVNLSALGAPPPQIASLIVVEEPVPLAPAPAQLDASFREVPAVHTPVAVCGVSWRVPVDGRSSVQVEEDCPSEYLAAVVEAAADWVFGAVSPAPGHDRVEVRRWFVLRRTAGQGPSWSAQLHPPQTSQEPDDKARNRDRCVRSVRKPVPSYPDGMQGMAVCKVSFHIDRETGLPWQTEVGGCPNQLGLSLLDAAARWRFKVCEESTTDDLTYELKVTYRR